VDFWGVEWVKIGPFNQIRRSPLQDACREEILGYEYPYDCVDRLLANMEPIVARAKEFYIGCDVSPCLFEMVCRLRGMENAILDLAADPELAEAMLERAETFARHIAEAACERFALDWLWTGDDVGGQRAMIMSPQCWRERIRPRLARIFDVGKSRGLWVAYHSCGAIRPILPDLVEMGLDVLNPVQCNCPGMDPIELKKEFGQELAFMGGVDTQGVLPNGTADEVRRETARLLEEMTVGGGGYILAASHAVPPETPIENIYAMYEAAGVSREEILDHAADIRAGRRGETCASS
jgi:uroporphyrinogen decarboxylase